MSRLVGAAGGALTHVIWTFRPVCERDARRSYRSGPRRPAVWCHGSMIRRTGFTSVSRRAISTQDPASGETVSNDCRNPGARRSLMAPRRRVRLTAPAPARADMLPLRKWPDWL